MTEKKHNVSEQNIETRSLFATIRDSVLSALFCRDEWLCMSAVIRYLCSALAKNREQIPLMFCSLVLVLTFSYSS